MAHDALALVTVDESTQKFVVNEEGLAYLRSLGSSPLAVVACAGTYRTGKSYLLNALSGNSGVLQGASAVVSPSQQEVGGSFPVGSTVKACTKGIWLCGGKRLEGREEDAIGEIKGQVVVGQKAKLSCDTNGKVAAHDY
jgi:hypothetical protein